MANRHAGKQVDPTLYFAIASLLEVLPAAVQVPAEITLWPVAVDQWRRMSIVTNEMTLLPLPLRWRAR